MDLDQANFSQGHNPSPIQRQNVLDGFLTNLHHLTKKKRKEILTNIYIYIYIYINIILHILTHN